MQGRNSTRWTVATALVATLAMPALAEPKVVTLGVAETESDPFAACRDAAASPFEAAANGHGLTDEEIYLDEALRVCETASAASPQSADVAAWLARIYILLGRAQDAATLLEGPARDSAFGRYLLASLLSNNADYGLYDDPARVIELLQQAADAGFAPAARDLAAHYEGGDGVDQDYAEALRLYDIAAAGGDGAAHYKVGSFYQAGLGTDVDFVRAREAYQKAGELGDPRGWYGLGELYQYGQGVDADNAKAAEFYQKGADANEPMSQTALAYLYEQGLGVPQDYGRSFALLSAAAAQNYAYGQASLALHYLYGEGTSVDFGKALDLAWTAATKDVTYAQGILGYLYAEGLGTDRDLSEALSHFQTGADRGDQYSASRIPVIEAELACQDAAGSLFEPGGGYGHGVGFAELDPQAAIPACQAALEANPGSVGDGVWLARAYIRDDDYDSALTYLDAGVKANNALALTLSAGLLLAGDGEPADVNRAIDLLQAAAAKEFAEAQFALGMVYATGEYAPVDLDGAKKLLQLAAEAGMSEAADELAALKGDAMPSVEPSLDVGFGAEGPIY